MLKKLMNLYHGNNDIEKIPPRSGFKRVGYIIMNYAGNLFVINLIFLLCCIPIVTIPSALIALNKYLIKIFQRGYNFSLADYFTEFKSELGKGLLLGVLPGVLLFYGYYLMSLSGNFVEDNMSAAVMGIGVAVFAIAMIFGEYLFLLAAMLDLPVKHLMKNGFILLMIEWKASMKVAIVSMLMIALLIGLLPYSLGFVIIGYFSTFQLMIIASLEPCVMKRIVTPYEHTSMLNCD